MAIRTGSLTVIVTASFLLIAGLSVICPMTDGSDATEGDQGNFHWVMDEDKNLTITGHGYLDIFEPQWNELITLTIVPDGEVNIKNNVFKDRDSLTALTVNGSVNDIGNNAFEDCDSLTTVTVNGSVGNFWDGAFKDCYSLTTVTVNGSVGEIEDETFYYCISLTTVTVNGSVGVIGNNAFYHCSNLSVITITGPITSIISSAFNLCNNIETVNIACNNMGITKGSTAYGGIAKNADTVNHVHWYSPTYDWAEDGSTCTVHLVCNNVGTHVHDIENIASESSVKVPATCTAGGTTEYSVSTTYEGFDYSSTKVQDTPALGHDYSATYEWSDDGSSCTVHIVCANNTEHNHDENATVMSTVKIQPTGTEMGTTEYSVSGTYDGFAYSDTKDIQDIPVKGGDSGGDSDNRGGNTPIYVAGAAIAVLAIAGGVFLFMRSRR